jgi:hypothetical protein
VPDADYAEVIRDKTYGPMNYGLGLGNEVLRPGKGHRWCWWSGMREDEILVFKIFDSARERAGAWRCAHTSAVLPGTEDEPPRESVEIRALVGY